MAAASRSWANVSAALETARLTKAISELVGGPEMATEKAIASETVMTTNPRTP
jgi:hypothetical protein